MSKGIYIVCLFMLIANQVFCQFPEGDSLMRANKVKSLLTKDCSVSEPKEKTNEEDEEYDSGGSCSATYTEYDPQGRIVYSHFLRMGSASGYIYSGDIVYQLYQSGEEKDTNVVEIYKDGQMVMIVQYESKDTTRYTSVKDKNGNEVASYSISKDWKSKYVSVYDKKNRCIKTESSEWDDKQKKYVVTSRSYSIYDDEEGKEIFYVMQGIKLSMVTITVKNKNRTDSYKWYFEEPGESEIPHKGNLHELRSYEIRDDKGRIVEKMSHDFDPCWLPGNFYITKYHYSENGLTEYSETSLENGKPVYTTSYEYSYFD